jgi:hypothetical protein
MKLSKLLVAAAVSGILAGAGQSYFQLAAAEDAPGDTNVDKHDCKGLDSCKGKGGCKTGDNGCKMKNSCKGKGGCATAKHDCAGQNDCKGKGKGGQNDCKGKGGCKTPGS